MKFSKDKIGNLVFWQYKIYRNTYIARTSLVVLLLSVLTYEIISPTKRKFWKLKNRILPAKFPYETHKN